MRIKKLSLTVAAGMSLLVGATCAKAVPYQYRDFDPILKTLDASNPSKNSYWGQFDIKTNSDGIESPEKDIVGYNPNTQTITSATAWFKFRNIYAQDDYVSVALNGELLFGTPLVTTFSKFGQQITGDLLIYLKENGTIDYTVTAVSGKFKLVWARLDVKATDRPVPVPDNGLTLSLMGLALFALAGYKWKFAA
jgi:hypothetical protein